VHMVSLPTQCPRAVCKCLGRVRCKSLCIALVTLDGVHGLHRSMQEGRSAVVLVRAATAGLLKNAQPRYHLLLLCCDSMSFGTHNSAAGWLTFSSSVIEHFLNLATAVQYFTNMFLEFVYWDVSIILIAVLLLAASLS